MSVGPGSHRRATALAASALSLSVACLWAPIAPGAKDQTTLISRQSVAIGGAGADATSAEAKISADGRYVVFASNADNLSDDDADAFTNVFVRDTRTRTTTLVSRRTAALGGAGADGDSKFPSISNNGRHVAFISGADNLSDADDDSVRNVFVRDLQTSRTTLVSRQSAAAGGVGGDGTTGDVVSISATGRFVAFWSAADNLSDADADAFDVFVRDMQTNATSLVSRRSAAGGGAGGDDDSSFPSISANGRHVAFVSSADNLAAAADDDVANVFVRDTRTNATRLVSRQSGADGGAGADGGSGSLVSISADGRHVAFASNADNLSAVDGAFTDTFLRDTRAKATTLVSRPSGVDGDAGTDGASTLPSLSADARYVAFNSNAANLSDADNDVFVDVFVRDTSANETTLVSRRTAAAGGAGADGDSGFPSISADGRYVAFSSDADNLSALDSDGVLDVFLRDVLGPPGLSARGPVARAHR